VGTEVDEDLHLTVGVDVESVEEAERGAREREREFGGFVGRKVVGEEEAERHARAVHDHKGAIEISYGLFKDKILNLKFKIKIK
jgi:hypothetical protein